jgi:hypothetical protein
VSPKPLFCMRFPVAHRRALSLIELGPLGRSNDPAGAIFPGLGMKAGKCFKGGASLSLALELTEPSP